MTSAGFGGRTGTVAFIVLSLTVVAVVWVAVVFDDQYPTSILERIAFGWLGGVWVAAVLIPITAVISAIVGLAAAIYHHSRTASS